MELCLEMKKDKSETAGIVTVNLLVLNNSYEPVTIDRRLLVGPNPVLEHASGIPFPVSVEPSLTREEENMVTLNPWCIYGRQRTFDSLPQGRATFYGYLLRYPLDALLPERPGEPEALLISAEPLIVSITG